AVDWWSVGVLTYELLTGASPFTVEGEKNTQQEITKRIVRCSYPVPPDVSPEVQDFIRKLLVKDPRRRLGGGEHDAEELKRHPFFQIISTQKKDIKQEIELLKACQGCPYIITLHEVFHDSVLHIFFLSYEERNNMYLVCRSLPYAAPEVVSRARSAAAPGYGPQCDLWSLGVVYYYMLCGKAPFQPISKKEPITAFMDRIRTGNFTMDGPIWESISTESKRIVLGLLAVDPLRRFGTDELLAALGVAIPEPSSFKLADMTKADLYKRRYKNKHRESSASEAGTSQSDTTEPEDKETSLIDTINNLKNRMNHNSLENDVELIKANTIETPVAESPEPTYTDIDDDVPAVKPVEKTYSKSRSKLDDYIYIESSQGLDGTEVAFPKTSRVKKSKSPVPRKRRKIEPKPKKEMVNGDRELRSKAAENGTRGRNAKEVEKRVLRSKSVTEKNRATKESIENEKTVVTRVTRKRKYEELAKPVLREKGQNGRAPSKARSSGGAETRKVARARGRPAADAAAAGARMTRSRRRRLEVSLSASEVPALAASVDSERVTSAESAKCPAGPKRPAPAKAKAKPKAGRAKRGRARPARR
ncbi:hypothetical protein HF086_014309, partial [Spodoptera exigua]